MADRLREPGAPEPPELLGPGTSPTLGRSLDERLLERRHVKPWILLGQPPLSRSPASQRTQAPLSVLGGKVGQGVHAPRAQPAGGEIKAVAVSVERVDQLVDTGRRRDG